MFEIGATYSRREDIHEKFGGQRQGGISTPGDAEYIFLFTGAAGHKHGYHDEVTEEGFRLYGEGQIGDMAFVRGNKAIRDHAANRKRLLLFQSMGKGKNCIFRGEYVLLRYEVKENVPDTLGNPRKAIVFVLKHAQVDDRKLEERAVRDLATDEIPLEETYALRVQEVRTKQVLFRDRLELIEKGCRITGVTDGRFLRASHIKPWADCNGSERIDGNNGLLLTPHADHLFDDGWITFDDMGNPIASEELPTEILASLGVAMIRRRNFPSFNDAQVEYLRYHRSIIFRAAARTA